MTQAPNLPLSMRRDGLDPVGDLGRARDDEGVLAITTPTGQSVYLVCRHQDVREVLSDTERFSSAASVIPGAEMSDKQEAARMSAGQLISFDPPEHTRLRRMLAPEFTMRRIRELEPRITEIVEAALDDLEAAGPPADLVAHFALPVPSLVICELLGVPFADRAEFQDRAMRLLDTSLSLETRIVVQREGRAYMADLVAGAQADPGDNLLGMLVRDHGDDLDTDELIGIAELLLLAGHETTSNMLGLGTLALLRHPGEFAALRDDPDLIDSAVEELLRWLSVVHWMPPRKTVVDVELAGHTIPAGSLVLPSLVAANRDHTVADDPDRLKLARPATRHVALGHGVHHCLGAPLARMEMRIAFLALLRRFPALALAEPYESLDFRAFSVVYGVHALPVTW
ncbi:cytochrome [Prauserella marina]|uniref:Cytochrome P450 n=1 Tax=Prauserella marina TaxID=530584 RepID=A0A222VMA2_9PSEU|nr:cytochrome P450 [Prauserella marina]ASR35007.1 cytochrome [Prauserella marina]PWV85262.1 cytochrome P450 [Prauserella marina]SDC01101.1 Cytochrome P450 [Prauserella marina]